MRVAVIYHDRGFEESDVINIFGPQSKEKYNPRTVERVAASLETGGHNVKPIEGNINMAEELRSFMPRVMAGERPGMVFNMAYGIQGQSRYTHIPAMLEMLGVPYVGSGPQAHGVALDKIMTKIVFQQNKIPTPGFWFYSTGDEPMDDVVYPVIVKPKMEAVSMGMKIVDNKKDLRAAVKEVIQNYQQQALVEQFISGREFAVGLLGNGADLEALPIVEFDFHGDPDAIQTQDDKLRQPVGKICPAKVSEEMTTEIKRLARECFNVLGISDFARIDLRMDQDENLYVLELNSMASLGVTGSYVHSAEVAGYTYESMINRMLDVAAVRYFGVETLRTPEDEAKQTDESLPLRTRIRSYVRSQRTTMEDMLREMVGMNSYVYNTEGVNELGTWISNRLARLNFNREVFPLAEVGNSIYLSNHNGEQNDILLMCHLDTFYSFQDFVPFREERGRYFGSGVAESKGGLAIMLGALQALRFTRRLRRVKCGILLTSDDTLGARFSHHLVEQFAERSKYVIGLEYGEANGGIVTSCSGGAQFQFDLTNIKKPDGVLPPDVIAMVCQKINAWQRLSSQRNASLVKATRLEARTLYGMAPDYASGHLYIRFKDDEQGDELEDKIRTAGRRSLGAKYQIRIARTVHRPAVVENDENQRFFEHVQQVAQRLEVKVSSVHRDVPSDMCYVPDGIPVLDGLGPLGGDSQSPNEYILRDSMIDRAALLAMVIRLSAEENQSQ